MYLKSLCEMKGGMGWYECDVWRGMGGARFDGGMNLILRPEDLS